MEKKDIQSISGIVQKDLEVHIPEEVNEQELLSAIVDRVTWMLRCDKDLLMSYLYRLDVLEHKINAALMPGNPLSAEEALGLLIFERQKERVETKKKYKVDPIEGWQY